MSNVSMIDGHIDEPKGMSDEDIIKALTSDRFFSYGGHSCVRCKYRYHKGEERCGVKGCKIARAALDLINRQKAEIEELQKRIVFWREYMDYHPERERAEVIKEFAERLKEKAEGCGRIELNGYTYCAVGLHHIDNLVKEMVGDNQCD